MKNNKLFKMLLITLIFFVVLTWFIPATRIESGKIITDEYTRIGIFKLFSILMIAIQNFAHFSLYLLIVGGFYGIVHKLPAYKKLVNKVVEGFQGRELVFFIAIGLFLAITSSMAGLALPMVILMPFIVSVLSRLGYNKTTAAMLSVGSITSGLMGTVFSVSTVSGFASAVGTQNIIKYVNGDILFKLLILFGSLILTLIVTWQYAKNHKEEVKLEKVEEKTKIWPLVVIFDLLILILILGYISWSAFEIKFFDNLVNTIVHPTGSVFTKGLLSAINSILGLSFNAQNGEISSFGNWTLLEAGVVVLIASLIISLMYKMKFNDYLSNFAEGARKAIKPALIVIIPYIILILVSMTSISNGILRYIMEIGKGVHVVPMSIVSLGFSTLGVEAVATSVFAGGYIASSGASGVLTAQEGQLIGLIFQSMYGLAMLFVPTSVILVGVLSWLEISYKEWLKSIWKLVLGLFILLVIILSIY